MNSNTYSSPLDIYFDVRSDAHGKDPDSSSKTLQQYHKILWSKKLPNGKYFNLDNTKSGAYLYHNSILGEYYLSSDSIIHTYAKWKRLQHVIKEIDKNKIDYFYNLAYTVGGFIIFPGNKVNKLNTINQERGMNKKINDRIDLTLECIRRYYNNETSPLFETIKRYSNFFSLFSNFQGYCDFFLLQDLVSNDYSKVQFFLPFNDFIGMQLPKDKNEYDTFRKNNINFLEKRIQRMKEYTFQY